MRMKFKQIWMKILTATSILVCCYLVVVAKIYAYHGFIDYSLSKTRSGRFAIYFLILIYGYYLINEIFIDKNNDD